MNKPIITRGGSLLERAAEVYDFQAHLRARGPEPIAEDAPAPSIEPVAGNPAATIAPPAVATVSPRASNNVAIDRELLVERGLLVPGAPVGVLAEEFRLAKRQLLLTARALRDDPAKARTILVCSPRPNEGKTYCAVNLAISMAAERDTHVLLVDADFAKPDVLARLGVDHAGPGLLDALADPAIDIESCVVGTDIPQLSLLPAGKPTSSDTELVASDRTAELIARLLAADPARVLVFDSPPALAASPASVLALHVGQVMLVVRADRTSEGDIRDTVQRLDGCEHIQLLLNSVAFSVGGHGYGTYYGQEEGQ